MGEKRNETKHKIWHVTPSNLERQPRERMCSSFALNPTSQTSLGTPNEHEMPEHLSVEIRTQVSHGGFNLCPYCCKMLRIKICYEQEQFVVIQW